MEQNNLSQGGKNMQEGAKTKDKALFFLIGLLVGAILATGAIFVYTLAEGANSQHNQMMDAGGMGGQMNGGQMGDGGTPPEMPNGNNTSTNGAQTNTQRQ